MQEDDDEASTARVPIVLAGLRCTGAEQAITACPDFQLGRPPAVCRHNADVHLLCYNSPDPGVTSLQIAPHGLLSRLHMHCFQG